MITGEIAATGGEVYVNGYKVSSQIEKVHENIGYCPQSDAIIPLLTAREHLIFFGRLNLCIDSEREGLNIRGIIHITCLLSRSPFIQNI